MKKKREGIRRSSRSYFTSQLAVTDDGLTWGSTPCSSCSCRDVVEGGSRPECEGCVWGSDEVWEQPAERAGRGQPLTEWMAGWGRQRRLWGERDLQRRERERDMYKILQTQAVPAKCFHFEQHAYCVLQVSFEQYTQTAVTYECVYIQTASISVGDWSPSDNTVTTLQTCSASR